MSKTNKQSDVAVAREHLQPEAFYRERLTARGIPAPMHDGVIGYLFHGWAPGHFLYAVLTNDLKGACFRADLENQAALCQYVTFFYQDVPSLAWGTMSKVEEWLEERT